MCSAHCSDYIVHLRVVATCQGAEHGKNNWQMMDCASVYLVAGKTNCLKKASARVVGNVLKAAFPNSWPHEVHVRPLYTGGAGSSAGAP